MVMFLFVSKYDDRFFKFKKLPFGIPERKGTMLNGLEAMEVKSVAAERHEDFIDDNRTYQTRLT